jgi:hypothetical protein
MVNVCPSQMEDVPGDWMFAQSMTFETVTVPVPVAGLQPFKE